MVFARKSDANLASLVKKLDKLVADNKDKKLRAFVNLIGENRDTLEDSAKEFARENKVANIPIVVPVEFENGPENFGISPDAEVTIMLYKQLSVVKNHAFGEDELKDGIEAVLDDVPKILE